MKKGDPPNTVKKVKILPNKKESNKMKSFLIPQHQEPAQQERPPQRSVESEASHVPAMELRELQTEQQEHISNNHDTV